MGLLQTTISTLEAVKAMDDLELNFVAYPQALRDLERIETEGLSELIEIIKAARRRVEVIEAERQRRLPAAWRWWRAIRRVK